MKLRQECLQLVCRVSEKYCNVRLDPTECSTFVDTNEESCKCCSNTTFLPESKTSHKEMDAKLAEMEIIDPEALDEDAEMD